jgi:Velvet factor
MSAKASQTSGYNNQTYFPPGSDQTSPQTPYSATPSEVSTWGYNNQSPQMERNTAFPPPPLLPSIHTFAQSESEPGTSAYRAWDTSTPYQPSESFADSQVDPALRAPPNSDGREWSQTDRFNQETYTPTTPQLDNAIYTPASYAQHPPLPHPPHHSSHYPPHVHAASQQSSSSNLPPHRHSYTRTLVGPLSSNASRLLDEHRKPGIFFLFQDLSIRTEGGSISGLFALVVQHRALGTFRLRLRLMNVGA